MPDSKVTDLTSAGTLDGTEVLYAVKDPSGTPLDRKTTAGAIKTLSIGAGSVSIASGKTFTSSNTLTLAGTDSTTMTFPSTNATIARTDAGNTFTGAQTFSVGTVNGTGLDISQTWTGTGTYTGLKYNVGTDSGPADAASLLLDLQVGGTSKVKADKSGNLTLGTGGSLNMSGAGGINSPSISVQVDGSTANTKYFQTYWNGDDKALYTQIVGVSTSNLIFRNFTSGSCFQLLSTGPLQLGAADAAAPVAQFFKVQGVVAGTTNTAGANFTIQGSQGTGTGAGGSIIFQVAPAGSSGTAQNAYSTALTIAGNRVVSLCAGQFSAGSVNFIPPPAGTGVYVRAAGRDCFSLADYAGQGWVTFTTNGFGFSNSDLQYPNLADLFVVRDTNDTLALRGGGGNATIRIYNNGTTSNFQRLVLSCGVTSNMAVVAANNGGTGVACGLQFGAALSTGGGTTNIFNINTSGHLVWNTDNTYDIGAATATRPANIYAAASIRATGSTAVIGYGTGAGGAVTQATSRTTGVTLNKGCGQITLVSAAGTTSWQSFTVSNTTVAATDTIIVNQDSGTDLYQIFVTNVAANSFQITFATTGGTTTEQPVFSFAVIKAVAA